jgi:hypothetical protein
MIQVGPPPDLPDEPSINDQRAVQVLLRSHGTPAVGDAFQEWFRKVREFQWRASTYENFRDQGGQFENAGLEMENAREEARALADKLARLVSNELASL